MSGLQPPALVQVYGDVRYISLRMRLDRRIYCDSATPEESSGNPRQISLAGTSLSTQMLPTFGGTPVLVWSRSRKAYRALWPRCFTRSRSQAVRFDSRIAQILYACDPGDCLLAESDWSTDPLEDVSAPLYTVTRRHSVR